MNDTPLVSVINVHGVDYVEVKRMGGDNRCLSIELEGADPFRKTVINVWKEADQTPELQIEGRRVEVA
jgi:hypothetical protein